MVKAKVELRNNKNGTNPQWCVIADEKVYPFGYGKESKALAERIVEEGIAHDFLSVTDLTEVVQGA